MADVRQGIANQALGSYTITLDDGETALIKLDQKAVDWDGGGFSWQIKIDGGSSVAVQHSLTREGDFWIDDPNSPFDEDRGGNERHRIERIRFTNTGDSAQVILLSPVAVTIET